MKVLNLALLLLVLQTSTSAQVSPGETEAHGLQVVQHKWRRDVYNPALDVDPFRANDEQEEFRQAQRETAMRERINRGQGQPTPPPATRRSAGIVSGGVVITYIYEAKVTNTGARAIRSIVWEYVFSERDSGRELGRRRFTTNDSIRSGKSKVLVGRSSLPPADVVDAAAGDGPPTRYAEQVIIQRVEFADGSVWQRDVD